MSIRMTRRALLRAGLGVGSAMLIGESTAMATTVKSKPADAGVETPQSTKAAVVQFRATRNLKDNAQRHCEFIRKCAADGARVVVFPECSLSGYFDESVEKATPEQLAEAEVEVGKACRDAKAYAIVGAPTKLGKKTYNSALVFTPDGEIIERYHKVHLAGERWATPGDHLSVFPIDGVLCSIIICHDERYPELVRLPVMAGARLIFYVSSESGILEEQKIEPYRAQICARAMENSVYILHANTPQDPKTLEGSHGQSRIIDSGGHVLKEASIFKEEVLTAQIAFGNSSGYLANQSLNCAFLKDWWEAGLSRVRVVKP